MTNNDIEMRRSFGCGYLPPTERAEVPLWGGVHDLELTVCAGYSTSLPEVIDIAATFMHWENGALSTACGGDVPPQTLVDGLTLYKAAINDREWKDHERRKAER